MSILSVSVNPERNVQVCGLHTNTNTIPHAIQISRTLSLGVYKQNTQYDYSYYNLMT